MSQREKRQMVLCEELRFPTRWFCICYDDRTSIEGDRFTSTGEGGFGMVVLDMGDIPPESLRRVPTHFVVSTRRAVEHTATVLLLVEQEPWAKTCASLVVRLRNARHVCARDSGSIPGRPVALAGWQELITLARAGQVLASWWKRSGMFASCGRATGIRFFPRTMS